LLQSFFYMGNPQYIKALIVIYIFHISVLLYFGMAYWKFTD
jgi:hypothetical protein